MSQLDKDLANLAGKAAKGDVLAGLSIILELAAGAGLVGGVFWGLLAVKTALLGFAPWLAPVLAPALIVALTKTIAQGYSNLEAHQRKHVRTAIGFLTGKVTLS